MIDLIDFGRHCLAVHIGDWPLLPSFLFTNNLLYTLIDSVILSGGIITNDEVFDYRHVRVVCIISYLITHMIRYNQIVNFFSPLTVVVGAVAHVIVDAGTSAIVCRLICTVFFSLISCSCMGMFIH